ncbi:hypothetical protein N7452_009107 [Penicillium brevicompactum]|uniref:RHD domain-containing protein n=1 Tax=Penicillium brevicompactum TaxID=5074 RepID=A0A9W9QCL0_PENBR|nr:hypothetical protein N7452_009107 [Penicillium brevicompactum]
MLAYTKFKMKSHPGLDENFETSNSGCVDDPVAGEVCHQSSGPLICLALEDYARTMLAYTQCQMRSFPGLREEFGTSNSSHGDDPIRSLLHYQGPGPPSPATAQEVGRKATKKRRLH